MFSTCEQGQKKNIFWNLACIPFFVWNGAGLNRQNWLVRCESKVAKKKWEKVRTWEILTLSMLPLVNYSLGRQNKDMAFWKLLTKLSLVQNWCRSQLLLILGQQNKGISLFLIQVAWFFEKVRIITKLSWAQKRWRPFCELRPWTQRFRHFEICKQIGMVNLNVKTMARFW